MDVLKLRIKKLFRRKFIQFGAPFVLIVVGGSFGLKYFAELRYTFRRTKLLTYEAAEKMGIKMKPPGSVTLESEYEKIKDLDVDNWENVRGPRPWEQQSNN